MVQKLIKVIIVEDGYVRIYYRMLILHLSITVRIIHDIL